MVRVTSGLIPAFAHISQSNEYLVHNKAQVTLPFIQQVAAFEALV